MSAADDSHQGKKLRSDWPLQARLADPVTIRIRQLSEEAETLRWVGLNRQKVTAVRLAGREEALFWSPPGLFSSDPPESGVAPFVTWSFSLVRGRAGRGGRWIQATLSTRRAATLPGLPPEVSPVLATATDLHR
jgi:hypothetical protein